jgi:hypothetical protein
MGDQHITSIIPTDEGRKLRLKKRQTAIALIKSSDYPNRSYTIDISDSIRSNCYISATRDLFLVDIRR